MNSAKTKLLTVRIDAELDGLLGSLAVIMGAGDRSVTIRRLISRAASDLIANALNSDELAKGTARTIFEDIGNEGAAARALRAIAESRRPRHYICAIGVEDDGTKSLTVYDASERTWKIVRGKAPYTAESLASIAADFPNLELPSLD